MKNIFWFIFTIYAFFLFKNTSNSYNIGQIIVITHLSKKKLYKLFDFILSMEVDNMINFKDVQTVRKTWFQFKVAMDIKQQIKMIDKTFSFLFYCPIEQT